MNFGDDIHGRQRKENLLSQNKYRQDLVNNVINKKEPLSHHNEGLKLLLIGSTHTLLSLLVASLQSQLCSQGMTKIRII